MITKARRLVGGALVIIMLCFFAACEKTVAPVMRTSALIQLDLSGLGSNKYHTKLIHELFSPSVISGKYAKFDARTIANTSSIDEVVLVSLDMTSFNNWDEFQNAMNASGQITYFNNMAKIDTTVDFADYVNMSFKGYNGNIFKYAGSYSIPLTGSTASTTIYLNPGLNYFFFAFRSGGKTVDYGDVSVIIKKTEDNVFNIGYSGIPTNGLIAFYPFDGNTKDASGYGRDMINSGATFTTGFDGKANSAVVFSNLATLRYENATDIQKSLYNPKASVSLWVSVPLNYDVNATQGGTVIFNVSGDWGDNEGVAISIPSNPRSIAPEINVNNTKQYLKYYPIVYNKFTHLVITYNGTTFKFYVNDTLWSSVAAAGIMTYSSTYHKMGIGWWDAVPTYEHYFTGTIDNVRLYDRALTEGEIDQLYHERSVDNYPPNIPVISAPSNGAAGVSTSDTLSWSCSDYDNDPLTYDVYLGTSETSMVRMASLISANNFSLNGAVLPNTTYYWQILVRDDHRNSMVSPVWNFTTGSK
jgi:hypothetical protein